MKEKIFCQRIAEAIKNSDYTQKQLARLLGISEGNITNWKKGDNFPSIDVFYKLCVLLQESADYLLGLTDS